MRVFYKLIGFISLLFCVCKSESFDPHNGLNYDQNKLNKLKKILNYVGDIQFPSSINLIDKSNRNSEDDLLCESQFMYILDRIRSENTELWMIKMLDSWGKIPSGILMGLQTYEFGNYDECLEVKHNTNENDIGEIEGQYCLAPLSLNILTSDQTTTSSTPTSRSTTSTSTVSPNNPFENGLRMMPVGPTTNGLTVFVGTCVPSTCSSNLIQESLTEMVEFFNMSEIITVGNLDGSCTKNDRIALSSLDIFAIVFYAVISLLLISNTVYDITWRYNKKKTILWLTAFSIYTNGKKIFSCKKSNSQEVMNCLNGIRVLSIVWVVWGHAYIEVIASAAINQIALIDYISKYHSMLLLSATVSVDSFFLLSGLLVAWSVFKELDKSRFLNVPLMFLHRYLRLTPAFAALILLTVTLLKYMSSGPLHSMGEQMTSNSCDKWWWSALLYVQNYVNPDEMCLGHSWYLSVDMQLFWFSPLILYPMWKWGKKIIGIVLVLILLSMGCVFATFYTNEYKLRFLSLANGGNILGRFKMIYYPTHTRMGAYLVGIILGYILHQLKGKSIRIPRRCQILGWIISIGTLLAVIFGQFPIQQLDANDNLIRDAFYESCSRVSWCIALGWIIFACVKGYGGIINSILSWSIWMPFARLSYSVYLTHFLIQMIMVSSIKTHSYFSDFSVYHSFWGDFGFSLTVSIFWCLAFESPVVVLEKYLIPRRKTLPESQQPAISSASSSTDTVHDNVADFKSNSQENLIDNSLNV